MATKPITPRQRKWFGALFGVTGLIFILMGTGIIPYEVSPGEAPPWVLALCGLLFLTAGIMIFNGEKGRHQNLLAIVFLGSLGTIGAWVALFSSADRMSGGLWFFSDSENFLLGRIIFGAGAVICYSLTLYILRTHFKKKKG